MTIHFLNCFTCNARVPANWQTGTLCLLAETGDGLVLVDTGPGAADYIHKPGIIRAFQVVTKVPLDPDETALRQIVRLGFRREDVHDIVLTHMHFDHCGGLADFPDARVHVLAREYVAFGGPIRRWTDMAYVRRHVAHDPRVVLYADAAERWFDFDAIRLPFEREMWLVPLIGHTRGHCGIAIRTDTGWQFHVGDAAAPVGLEVAPPAWLVSLVLGPHQSRLRRFADTHPDVLVTTGHMPLDFFRAATAEGSPGSVL